MPIGVIASTQPDQWEPRDKDLKHYFHFDRFAGHSTVSKIANDPVAVAAHSFFPLIRFHEKWTKFRAAGQVRKKKARPLRYAAHIDAAIFARYRSLLAPLYEDELLRRGLSDVPVAYRRILQDNGVAKSNIEISRDVFKYIMDTGECVVTVVDIKSYFESLDHGIIAKNWACLIGGCLSADHLAVYNAVTKYSVVDYEKLIVRLSLLERKIAPASRSESRKRNIDILRSNNKKQICSTKDFRRLVAGGDPGKPSLIQKNGFDFGIPQGTPISDLIANFYLIDFDEAVNKWVSAMGGIYRRYSDDIIVVIPTEKLKYFDQHKSFLQHQITQHGSKLRIQDKKVCIVQFSNSIGGLDFKHIFGSSSRNGLEYLGFEFDGRIVKIKNSTLSGAWRKMKRQALGHAFMYVKRYRDKGISWIKHNYPCGNLERNILQDVTYRQDKGYESWTFVKYTRRASRAFIGLNPIFSQQTKKYRYYTKKMIEDALDQAIKKVAPKFP